MERYNRQIMLPEIGEEGQAKLKAAKVLLIGAGGLGSPISLYLAGAGIGTIGIVDDDVVAISNLHRQILYEEAQTGKLKALCASIRLKALNSEITVNAYPEKLTKENAHRLISQYDIVVDACDNFATRYLIDDTCIELGKPYVYGAISGFQGQVSVFNYQTTKSYRDLYPDENSILKIASPSKAVIGITPGIIGCVEAMEVIKIVGEFDTSLAGKLWVIDLRTLKTNIFSL